MTSPGTASLATGAQIDSLAESLSIASQPDTLGPFRYWHEHSQDEKQRWRRMVEVGVNGWLEEHSLSIAPATAVVGEEAKQAWARIRNLISTAEGYGYLPREQFDADLATLTALLGRTGEGNPS